SPSPARRLPRTPSPRSRGSPPSLSSGEDRPCLQPSVHLGQVLEPRPGAKRLEPKPIQLLRQGLVRPSVSGVDGGVDTPNRVRVPPEGDFPLHGFLSQPGPFPALYLYPTTYLPSTQALGGNVT